MNSTKVFLKEVVHTISQITHLSEQFVRFILVGMLNTIFGYGAFAFFVFSGFNYIFAPFFSTIVGVLFNFKTIGVLVFRNGNNRLIARFFGVYGIVYLCNVFALKIFAICGVRNMYFAGFLLLIPLALLGYLLNKKFVFERKKK